MRFLDRLCASLSVLVLIVLPLRAAPPAQTTHRRLTAVNDADAQALAVRMSDAHLAFARAGNRNTPALPT